MVTLKLSYSPCSKQVSEEITRIVSIPAMAVQPGWQMPMAPPGPQNQLGTNAVGNGLNGNQGNQGIQNNRGMKSGFQ